MKKGIPNSPNGEVPSHLNSLQFGFENNAWENNKKKELPPLKETVQIYRKQNSGKHQELFDKWHSERIDCESKDRSQTSLTNITHQVANIGYTDDNNGDFQNCDKTIENSYSKVDITNENTSSAHRDCVDQFENFDLIQEPKFVFSKKNSNTNLSKDYQKIALELALPDSKKIKKKDEKNVLPDMVLVFNVDDSDVVHKKERDVFESLIQDEDVTIVYNVINENVFVELYASFERLCQEAETVALEMPLEGVQQFLITLHSVFTLNF